MSTSLSISRMAMSLLKLDTSNWSCTDTLLSLRSTRPGAQREEERLCAPRVTMMSLGDMLDNRGTAAL